MDRTLKIAVYNPCNSQGDRGDYISYILSACDVIILVGTGLREDKLAKGQVSKVHKLNHLYVSFRTGPTPSPR